MSSPLPEDSRLPSATSVEGGAEPVELFEEMPGYHFFVLALFNVYGGYWNFIINNLRQECFRVYGAACFSFWENPAGICMLVHGSRDQLSRVKDYTKETMRIWGAHPEDLTEYRADSPRRV